MSKKLKVGLIFGGRSGEHEISVRSATSVLAAINYRRYEVIPIAIDRRGNWLPPSAALGLLPTETARLVAAYLPEGHDARAVSPISLIVDTARSAAENKGTGKTKVAARHSSVTPARRASVAAGVDVVFPLLHGTYGEDGTIQGLLEMADAPYVGCGVLASSCGMDKVVMKSLLREAGLPLCRYTWFLRSEWEANPESVLRRVAKEPGYPCFVKPANLGSSVGISRASDKASLRESINLAARFDRKIIVEEEIDAREIECALLGNDRPQASLPGEYVIHDARAKFLDYTEKYANTGRVEFVVPAPLAKDVIKRVQEMAVKAFRAIDGAGLARADFFVDRRTRKLYLNELNTMPGLTDVSGYPQMWKKSGLEFAAVLDRLIDLAVERHREKSRNETAIT